MSAIIKSVVSNIQNRRDPDALKPEKEWVFDYPVSTQMLKISSFVCGVGLLASFPLSATTVAVSSGLMAASGALFSLDRFTSKHHDMSRHVFQPGTYEGGELYYEGDVPILVLNADDPYWAGRAHGYLCGDALNRNIKQHPTFNGARASQIPHVLAAIRRKIPSQYLREMKGIVDGYRQWAKEHRWHLPHPIDLAEIELIQLRADKHFQALLINGWIKDDGLMGRAVACTALVDQDPDRGLLLARNMDWPNIGTYSLVIHRRHSKKLHSTVEIGIPGFVGTITGMNDQRLSLAMNVNENCSVRRGTLDSLVEGMPATLYNRACLEHCDSVSAIEKFIKHTSPLGSYHVTAVDRERGQAIHFYQSPQKKHVIRPYHVPHPLVTLNGTYSRPDQPPARCGRGKALSEFVQARQGRAIEEALALPHVNKQDTAHCVVMEPQTGNIRLAFDNAFAAKVPKHLISTDTLFSRKNPT